VWARHRLDRVATPSTRAEALLRGAIHPSALSAGERQDLLDVVSIQALNQLAGYLSSRRQEFEQLMASLADLPLPATTRVALWTGMIARLPNGELRRELFESVEGLRVVGSEEPSVRQSCSEIIVPILLDAGKRDSDETLVKILEGRAPSADVLTALADWAEKLDFEAEADKRAAAAVPLSVPDPVAPQRVEPSQITAAQSSLAAAVAECSEAGPRAAVSAIDTWVLRLRGLNPPEISEFTTAIGFQLRECMKALTRADSVAELTRALTELSSFQQVSADWLARLPKPADLASDRDEAASAYDNAAKVLAAAELDDIVQNELITPAEMTDIVRLISDAATLKSAPEWMWRVGDVNSDAATPSSNAARARSLAEPRRRAAFVRFADLAQQLGEPTAVQWLPPLPLGRPPEESPNRVV
jgi:hypothetical protein